jgi:hypothetical protein
MVERPVGGERISSSVCRYNRKKSVMQQNKRRSSSPGELVLAER